MKPILEHLSGTSRGLADTAERIRETQTVVARTAEGVRSSLEHAAAGVDDQRQFIEVSLGEIRRSLIGLGDGLGDSLQRSLREVDDVLGNTVGQLRKTLAESNETIERLAGPIRAAEGTTRETHVALDRVRTEVEALGQWMAKAVKPLHKGLSEVGGRAEEISRTMAEFSSHTRQIDKTMEALREEIHGESRRLQSTGSELNRRLKLANDTVGFLESAAADATAMPRERSWSPPPETRGREASEPSPSRTPREAGPDSVDATESSNASDPGDSLEMPGLDRGVDDVNPTRDGAQRGNATAGQRVGTPRAQGPDPYSRFDGDPEPASNIRRFSTSDREPGDDLKLSGLLGPSTGDDRGPASARSKSSDGSKQDVGKTSGKNSDSSDKRSASTRASDESE
jgi:methyl-accepting chemotaxis protein